VKSCTWLFLAAPFIFCSIPAAAISGQTPASEIEATVYTEIGAMLRDYLDKNRVPGLEIALVDRNGIFWQCALGVKGDSDKSSVDAKTTFLIASVTKPLTAAIILKAVQEGILNLDLPVTKYLPKIRFYSRYEKEPERKITLRHLLTHRAGLAHETPLGNNWDGVNCSFAEHVQSLYKTWLKWPVGQRNDYSGAGFDLAAYILQRVMKKDYAQCARELLFDPLEMTRTTLDSQTILSESNRTLGHTERYQNRPPVFLPDLGGGAAYSTAEDLAKFIRFYLNQGESSGRRVIAASLLEEMTKPQWPAEGQINGSGLGLNIRYDFDGIYWQTPRLLHTGGGRGFGAVIQWFPEFGIGLALVTNSWDTDPLNLSDQILKRILDHRGVRLKPYETVPEIGQIQPTAPPDPAVQGDYLSFKITVSGAVGMIKIPSAPETPFVFTSPYSGYYRDRNGLFTGIRFYPWETEPHKFFALNLRSGFFFSRAEPLQTPGPGKRHWRRYTGKYVRKRWGEETGAIHITIRGGWLYADGTPLLEVKKGVFYQVNGDWNNSEVFDFRGAIPTYRNLKLVKVESRAN